LIAYFIEMLSKEGVAALTTKVEQPSQEIRFDIELARHTEVPNLVLRIDAVDENPP
jgi:hypothetical protein